MSQKRRPLPTEARPEASGGVLSVDKCRCKHVDRTPLPVAQAYSIAALLIVIGLCMVLTSDSHGVLVIAGGISMAILGRAVAKATR
jgi:hypothetical protein